MVADSFPTPGARSNNMETQHLPQYGSGGLREQIARAPLVTVSNTVIGGAAQKMYDCPATGKTFIVDDDRVTYEKMELLGKGGFASVFRLTTGADNQSECAGKIINKRRMILKPEKKDKISREIDIQRKMRHINVVRFIKFFEDDQNVYIVMENCGSMTLSKILKMRGVLTEPEVRYYLRQLISGCEHIHSLKVVHRDLKLSNIFITQQMVLKIGDFGLSAYIMSVDDKKESICGTPNYISPEVISKMGHSYPADIWAIGCVIYALLSGRPPFETDCLKTTYKLIARSRYNDPPKASLNARYLIAKCLKKEPQDRPTLNELKSDPFVTSEPTPVTMPFSAASSRPTFYEFGGNNNNEGEYVPNNNTPIPAIRFYINTFDQLEICAQGGKPLRDHYVATHACSCLLNRLRRVLHNVKACHRDHNPQPKPSDTFIWVTKWVDYSHKYGFGFQLSNEVCGASFTDTFSMAINSGDTHVGLQDPVEGVSIACPINQLPAAYDRNLQVMKYFMKYMDDTLIRGSNGDRQPMDIPNLQDVYMLRWQRTKNSIIMCLSSGTVQVNWLSDHTKLAVGKAGERGDEEHYLLYIDTKRRAYAYTLEDVFTLGVVPEIALRLEYFIMLLDKLITEGTSV